jgi:hypothetical protein
VSGGSLVTGGVSGSWGSVEQLFKAKWQYFDGSVHA